MCRLWLPPPNPFLNGTLYKSNMQTCGHGCLYELQATRADTDRVLESEVLRSGTRVTQKPDVHLPLFLSGLLLPHLPEYKRHPARYQAL